MNSLLTNRAKLLQTNEYDLLMKMNDNLVSSTRECDIRHFEEPKDMKPQMSINELLFGGE